MMGVIPNCFDRAEGFADAVFHLHLRYNRDAYTSAKGDFIDKYTLAAKNDMGIDSDNSRLVEMWIVNK